MSRKVCLYNGSDMDGITSAAIVRQKYPDILMYSLSFDDPFDCKGVIRPSDEVIIVNFTLQPFHRMVDCNNNCDLTWITHSDTSIDEYNEYLENGDCKVIKGSLDTGKPTCELVWEYLFPDVTIPYTVWLIGRYAMWDYDASPSVLPFQFGMKLNYKDPEDDEFWGRIFNANRDGKFIHRLMNDGYTIINYRSRLNEQICKSQAFESTLVNYKCICVNRGLCGSLVFESVWDCEKYDLMVVFFICNEGAWNVSLYSDRPDVDVGKIAQRYGGGGNQNTAGFRCSLLPLDIDS